MIARTMMIVVIYLFIASSAYAESIEVIAEHKFSGSIELGGDKTSGNTKKSAFDSKLVLGHVYAKWSSEISFKTSQSRDDTKLTSDSYDAIFRSLYDLPAHFYTFIQLGYREDSFSGVYVEKTYIGGFGYHAFTGEPDYSLDVEIGYGERVTTKIVNGFIRAKLDYDPGAHIGIKGQYNFTKDDMIKVYLSGEFGNDDDFIKNEISWVHKLFGALQASVNYESITLTEPGVDKVATDEKVSFKLGYTF